MNPVTILDEILEHKRSEVAAARLQVSSADMAARAAAVDAPTRGFKAALTRAEAPAVIAEIKRRSPSKGLIRADFEPGELAAAYQAGGAAALSVLTDEHFFGGDLCFLAVAREATSLPLLRKDFVVDAYQIDEARAFGADAVLLIVAALEPELLVKLHKRAVELGLDVLVEVHDEAELEVALDAEASLIGVNNRDLKTFEVDLAHTERVAAHLASHSARAPGIVLVAESGILEYAHIQRLQLAGARAFLVGESLMREADVSAALRRLRRAE
jgi:indole-3-glycerol phosphate synthase